MHSPLIFEDLGGGNINCTLDLGALYQRAKDIEAFDKRWIEFLDSDPSNGLVLKREGDIITYPHKSWLPESTSDKPSLLLLFGNPAPHSVLKDIYFAYEGNGAEHRFWKVLRELGFTDLSGADEGIKAKFLSLNHTSPFRLGFEVIYTFPSSASRPKWSGVLGVERLFGRKAMAVMTEIERSRLATYVAQFLDNGGAIIALQKDAYNAVSHNPYNLKQAIEGKLRSTFQGAPVYGTPPTRWLYTVKMKGLLSNIRDDVLHQSA